MFFHEHIDIQLVKVVKVSSPQPVILVEMLISVIFLNQVDEVSILFCIPKKNKIKLKKKKKKKNEANVEDPRCSNSWVSLEYDMSSGAQC